MLDLEEVEGLGLLVRAQSSPRVLRELADPAGQPVRRRVGLARFVEAGPGVLPHRFEQAVAVGLGLHHRLVHETGEHREGIEVVTQHHVRRIEGEPAGEHGETPKAALLVEGQQVVAPVEGGPHRAVPFRHIARTGGAEGLVETVEQRLGAEEPGVGGGQLQRQGEPVEPTADLGHRRCRPLGEREAG